MYLPCVGRVSPQFITQESYTAQKKDTAAPPATAQYRLNLDRAVVAALRVKAARMTLAVGHSTTWVGLLREAAKVAAEGGMK